MKTTQIFLMIAAAAGMAAALPKPIDAVVARAADAFNAVAALAHSNDNVVARAADANAADGDAVESFPSTQVETDDDGIIC
ncbi:hypothetical protein TI39_contig295g00016 [Zymoseptoria brevis]|uniref:Fungal calcium binding protein domain-containing protein n=1 Tax=Zymoseptoria brevis TaxID=1047168 RepID=A0A0F4GV90_9PEZI|nr:hypothetical protein TI39_contig295g00016 [Zymoseptoria brevis]